MTRALLKRCNLELLSVLDSCNEEMPHHDGDDFHELLRDVMTELAKPAPTQPAWHDAPTQPGLWVVYDGESVYVIERIHPFNEWDDGGLNERFFGPLPEDTK